MICMHRDDSDQPAHLPSLIKSLHCALNRKLRTQCFFMRTTEADAQAGSTAHCFVFFFFVVVVVVCPAAAQIV